MYIRLLSYVFIFIASLADAPAQIMATKIDSVQTLLRGHPTDTLKVKYLLALNLLTIEQDSANSMGYFSEALKIAKRTMHANSLADCYLRLTHFYDLKGDLYAANVVLDSAEILIDAITSKRLTAKIYMQRGILFYFAGSYQSAIDYLWKALRLYEELNDATTMASCYLTIGTSYNELELIDEAMGYYEKAYSIYKNSGDEKLMAMAVGNMGMLMKRKGEYEKAMAYFKNSLGIHEKYNNLEDMIVDMGNIGDTYLILNDFQNARDILYRARTIGERSGAQYALMTINYNIATLHLKLGSYTVALEEFKNCLEQARKLNYKELIKDCYQSLSFVYEKMGEFKLALDERKEYELFKDSLLNETYLQQIKELEIRYESEKKNQQISLLKQDQIIKDSEIKRQSDLRKVSLLVAGVFILVGTLVFLLLFQRFRNQRMITKKNELVRNAEFKQQLTDLEMKALRAQINPHFIFNCMNSINLLILNGNAEDASRYLSKFAKLIRMILENSEEASVSLEDELQMVEHYIQLEAMRFKEKIDYEIHVEDAINKNETHIPSMVLQPFVENAIWHGLMHKVDSGGMLLIKIAERDNVLLCTVEDNGVGRERSREIQDTSMVRHNGVGMKITEQRLRLLNEDQLEELISVIDLTDAQHHSSGTRIQIKIPIT